MQVPGKGGRWSWKASRTGPVKMQVVVEPQGETMNHKQQTIVGAVRINNTK